MSSRLRLHIETIRHLRARQVIGRVRHAIQQRLTTRLPAAPSQPEVATLNPAVPFLLPPESSACTNPADGTVAFLNETRTLGRPVDWNPEASNLGIF